MQPPFFQPIYRKHIFKQFWSGSFALESLQSGMPGSNMTIEDVWVVGDTFSPTPYSLSINTPQPFVIFQGRIKAKTVFQYFFLSLDKQSKKPLNHEQGTSGSLFCIFHTFKKPLFHMVYPLKPFHKSSTI